MLSGAGLITRFRDTGVADEYVLPPETPPLCDAVTTQVPTPVIVTVEPDNVQGPLTLKVTGKPDEAVAVSNC